VSGTQRRRILVVEDDPDQFDALAFALDGAGYTVEHARDGSEALAVMVRFRPDIVVTDLVMPGMSGEDLIRVIRESETDGSPRPRVLVASGMDGLNARCHALGADECLVKPFNLDSFLESIQRQLAAIDALRAR
jgi:CheY-like chemotaxis protein